MPRHLQFDPFHGRHPPAPSEGTSCSTCSGRTSSHTPPARPRMDRWRWCTIRGTCHVRRHSPGFLGRSDGTDPSIRPRRTREDLRLRELRERRVRSVVSSRPRTPGGSGLSLDDPKRRIHFSAMAEIDAPPVRCTSPNDEPRSTPRDS